MKKYDKIISQLSSGNWDESLAASDKLVDIYKTDNNILDLLVNTLEKSNSNNAINAIALALREISDNRSLSAILKAIKNKRNINNISTLVYALEKFNCKNNFLDIFSLFVLSNKADVMMSAFNILNKQKFNISEKDLLIAQDILNNSNLSFEDKKIAQEIINKQKIQNLKKDAAKKKRGETHGKRGKGY